MASGRRAFFLMIACSASPASLAQPIDPSIEQVSDAPASADMPLNPPELRRSAAPPAQLASDAESSSATVQVNREHLAEMPPDQLSKGAKTAQPPQPLSAPAQGRRSTVERLTGTDRCDPAEPKRPKPECAKVIENRSAEFARPDPNVLSPEQRLLLEQELREGALDAEGGARRLAATGEADESLAAMGVAATVLRPKDDIPENAKAEEDAAKAAEIVGTILNQPLPLPPQ